MARRMKLKEASLINRTTIRVRFSEVDSMRIVWHGEYIRYFEDGRESFGRQFSGLGYMEMHEAGYFVPMVHVEVDFKSPLAVGDTVIIETRYINSEAAKICFQYVLYRESDMQVVATGESMQVFLNRSFELELVSPLFYQEWKKRWNIE